MSPLHLLDGTRVGEPPAEGVPGARAARGECIGNGGLRQDEEEKGCSAHGASLRLVTGPAQCSQHMPIAATAEGQGRLDREIGQADAPCKSPRERCVPSEAEEVS